MSWFRWGAKTPKTKQVDEREEPPPDGITEGKKTAKTLIRCMMKENIPILSKTLQSIKKEDLRKILLETEVIHAYGKDVYNSPLNYACKMCSKEICEIVFEYISSEHNEWFTANDINDWSAIQYAAINSKDDILELLYNRDKKLVQDNIKTKNVTTLLHLACKYKSEECVKWLLEHEADFKANNEANFQTKNIYGQLPIHYAAWGGDTKVFTLIFKKYEEEDLKKRKEKMLENKEAPKISKEKDIEADAPLLDDKVRKMVDEVLKKEKKKLGEDALKLEDNDGEIPLFYAARELNLECIETILGFQQLADATDRNNECDTALHFVCNNMTQEVLLQKIKDSDFLEKKLKIAKAKYPLRDYGEGTECMSELKQEACQDYCTEKLANILKANALLGVKNEAGNKPLDWMSYDTVKYLLDRNVKKKKVCDNKDDTSKKDKYMIIIKNFFGHHASGSDMKNILAIANSQKHEELALHPLCQSIVSINWQKMEKYFFLKALFFIPLVIMLSIYSLLLEAKQSSTGNSTDPESHDEISNIWLATYCLLLIQVLFGSLSVFVLLGPFMKESKAYTAKVDAKHIMRLIEFYGNELLWSDWPEYLLWICSFLLLHGCIPPIFVVIIAWFSLFLVCSKHPSILPFRYIFVKILYRYIRFVIFAFGLITGFGMGFYFLLSTCISEDNNGTKGPCVGGAFDKVTLMALKIPSMMMGEITYDEFPFEHAYPWLYILFGAFIFLVTCCLFNMMNGLAVNITDQLMKKSEIFKTIAECEMIYEFEVLLKEVSSWLKWLGFGEISFLSPIWFDKLTVSPSTGICTPSTKEDPKKICKGYKLSQSIVNKAKDIGTFTETQNEADSEDDDELDIKGNGSTLVTPNGTTDILISHLEIGQNNLTESRSQAASREDCVKLE